MFTIKFKNDVTVTVDDASNDETLSYIVSASHDKTGPLQVTSFEKRYTEDETTVFGLKPDELPRFLVKSCGMRFTEEGEKYVSFFDF